MEIEGIEIRRSTRWYTHVGDFLNTLKAFIGTNYQGLPFAFANSGLAFGIAGVFVVATLTDHCCQLLVRNKVHIIEKRCRNDVISGKIHETDAELLRERLQLCVGYGDIGKSVFGNWCYQLIQISVCFTQFLTCLVYFVFIANTVSMIFPLTLVENCTTTTNEIPIEFRRSSGGPLVDSYRTSFGSNETNNTVVCDTTEIPSAPDLRLVVLFPLPIFVLTSLIRNVRYLAPLSSIATVALAVGAISVLSFLIHGFSVVDFHWYKLATLPMFLCQLISAYEGIGCILPIQSSMIGSRHLFPRYLHANIYLIFVILCTFGTIGYLRYGDGVKQIIVLEIAQHTILSILVDITLIISVLFTYPLQCYPVIEIVEAYLLGAGNKSAQHTSPSTSIQSDSEHGDDEERERRPLLKSLSIDLSISEVANMKVSDEVSAWKRNVIRIILTFVIAGLAILLRNYFAYLAAFSGAVGCSLLAFILPCTIDIRLRHNEMSRLALVKDVCIIVFAVVVSISGLVVIVMQIARGDAPP